MAIEHAPDETGGVLSPQLAELIKPEHTGIIVVDVMDAYFDQNAVLPKLVGFGTAKLDATARKIKLFLEAARRYSPATIVFTRMVERPDAVPSNLAKKMALDDTPPLVEENGAGWNYYLVRPQEGDHEIIKTHYNAFKDTDLDEHLREKGVQSVIVVGGYGSRCVARTADAASDDYGYHTFVPRDLIANPDTSDKPGQSEQIDEIAGFLQGFDIILGYTPPSEAILNTWERSLTIQP